MKVYELESSEKEIDLWKKLFVSVFIDMQCWMCRESNTNSYIVANDKGEKKVTIFVCLSHAYTL